MLIDGNKGLSMKRICHLCLNGPYNEGWNYQENIMPKYHAKQGYEVFQLVTPYMWEGTKMVVSNDHEYTNRYGVHVYRCRAKKGVVGGIRFNRYPEVMELLEKIHPDILFIHDVQCLDMTVVAKYLSSHRECTAFADNHSDFSNSARNWISLNIIHKIIWKHMAHTIEPYIKKFYGVLPARVDFLTNIYGIPKEKVELLVMGADDEFVEGAKQNINSKKIREKYGIEQDDFLILTGGKIDLFKTQTILLMQAVHEIKDSKVKLLVFGSVAPELKDNVNKLSDGVKVQYIGWIDAIDSYDFFAISDLVVFPGRHSVFWEQVCGQGIPMLVKDWDGTHHVDLGGNVLFLKEDSCDEIRTKIELVKNDKKVYSVMKSVAEQKGIKNFSYDEISKRAIE